MTRAARLAAPLALALLLFPSLARAQNTGEGPPPPFPDAKKFSRGLVVEAGLGGRFYVGKVAGGARSIEDLLSPGAVLSIRVGWDVFRWLALLAHVDGTTTSAREVQTQTWQGVQLYQYTGEARAQLQLRRVGLFLSGGAGVVQMSSNVLVAAGVRTHVGFAATGAAGLDLHTLNRHFSVGLYGEYAYLDKLGHSVAAMTHLRYEY